MSFFFTNKSKKDGLLGNKQLLRRLQCTVCPLDKVPNQHPKIQAEGSTKQGSIYVLGLGPGPEEDEQGHFWVGPASQLLKSCFTQAQWDDIRYNNVTRCREVNNSPPQESIEACSPFLEADILKYRPRAVFAMGAIAVRWCLQIDHNISINNWRGHPFPFKLGDHTCWVFPMLHPAYLLRGAGHLTPVFKLDIKNAYDFLNKNYVPIVQDKNTALDNIEIIKTIPQFKLGLKKIYEEYKKWHISAVDFETQEKRPYRDTSKLISASIGTPEYAMAFALMHRQARWTPSELQEVFNMLEAFLLDAKILKSAHNLAFELEWACTKINKNIIRTNWVDTMCSAYLLGYGGQSKKDKEAKGSDNESPDVDAIFTGLMSLDNQCKIFFGFFLKSLFHFNMTNLDWEDLDDLLLYNGGDTLWDSRLYLAHKERINEIGLNDVYLEQCRRIPTLVLTQIKGIPVDIPKAQELYDKYGRKKSTIYNGINKHPQVLEYKANHKFEANSWEDVAKFFQSLGYDMSKTDKKTGKVTLTSDEEKLSTINHIVAKSVLSMRELGKAQSTYLKPVLDKTYDKYLIYPDGLLHTLITSLFTTTNRTSAREPNIQNFPSHGPMKEVKGILIPPFGFLVGKNDYGQLEFRVMAMASKDKKLVKYIWDGYDVHADWARRWAKKCPAILFTFLENNEYPDMIGKPLGEILNFKPKTREADAFKAWRGEIKNSFVFAKFYGAADNSIAGYLNAPKDVAREIGTEFWEEFNGYKEYQDKTVHDYEKNGYITLLNGLRRYAYIDHGQIINTPIQGCLQKDSKIKLESGALVSIVNLVGKKEMIWIGGDRYAEATAINRGSCQLAIITLSSGLQIKCDIRHKLKNEKREWVDFSDLKIGSWVALPILPTHLKWSGKYNWPFILGAYVGDGSFYLNGKFKYPRFSISGAEEKSESHRDALFQAIKDLGFFPRWDIVAPLNINHQVKENISVDGREFAKKLLKLGVEYGKNAHTKRIPHSVWLMSDQDKRDFLEGLFYADGSKVIFQENNLHLCNKELLQEVQILAGSIGMDSSLSKTKNGWLLRFRKDCSNWKGNKRIFPSEAMEITSVPKAKYGTVTYQLHKERVAEHRAFKHNLFTQPIAERIYRKYLPDKEIYRYDKISKIEILDKYEDTFTLSVNDPLHQFVADGVIHKNSAIIIVMDAMNRLSELGEEIVEDEYQANLNIHDDLTFFLAKSNWAERQRIIIKEMITVNHEFINVPLVVESEIGTNLASTKVFGVFASNKMEELDSINYRATVTKFQNENGDLLQ